MCSSPAAEMRCGRRLTSDPQYRYSRAPFPSGQRFGGILGRFGGVAEWLKAADCKSARVRVRRFESYPLHHAWTAAAKPEDASMGFLRGCSSMVELQPSKLAVWVRFPSPAPIAHCVTPLGAAR